MSTNKHEGLTALFTDIADAIREKTGGTATLIADDFPNAIRAIDTSADLSAEIAAQNDIILQIQNTLESKAMDVNTPEMCTVTMNFLENSQSYTANYWYLGVNEDTNTIEYFSVQNVPCGVSHTISCVKHSAIEIYSNGVQENEWGFEEYYPQIEVNDGYYVGGNGADRSMVMISVWNDLSLNVKLF